MLRTFKAVLLQARFVRSPAAISSSTCTTDTPVHHGGMRWRPNTVFAQGNDTIVGKGTVVGAGVNVQFLAKTQTKLATSIIQLIACRGLRLELNHV